MTARGGTAVTAAALEELRLGNSVDASRAELEVIAEFFGVPVCYLTNTGVRTGIDAQLHLVKVMRDAGDLRPRKCQVRRQPASVTPLQIASGAATVSRYKITDQ